MEKVDSRAGAKLKSQKPGNGPSIGWFPKHVECSILDGLRVPLEKLVGEYGRLSGNKHLKRIPQELRRHILVDITDRTTYSELRMKLLQYERSNQKWSVENILGSLSVQCSEYFKQSQQRVSKSHPDGER